MARQAPSVGRLTAAEKAFVYAWALARPGTGSFEGFAGKLVVNILVLLFAILLCLVNALVWTFLSEMPLVGFGWIVAAIGCFWLQKWSRG